MKTIEGNSRKHKAPYVQGVTERVGKVLRRAGIKPIFRSTNKSKDFLGSTKDAVDKLSNAGVYEISCECGLVYIGETGRAICTRLSEHERYIRLGQHTKSAVSEHHKNVQKQMFVKLMGLNYGVICP